MVTECQIILIKMCKKCIESSIRPSGIWFTNVLRHLREDVRIECPDKLHPYNWQPHLDIMPAHTTWAVSNFWMKMTWLLASLTPHFPILSLYACFLFSEMKIQLKDEDLIVNHRGGGQLHETGVLELFPAVREALTTVCKLQGGLLWRRQVHSVQQKSIGLKFSKSRMGSHVTYSCHHNLSRFSFPIFVHSWRFSVFHSLQSITPHIY